MTSKSIYRTTKDIVMTHNTGSIFRSVGIGALVVASLGLAGCAPANSIAPSEAAAATDPPVSSPEPVSAEEVASWPSVEQSGTGPTTITIPNPSSDAFYLRSTFTCSSGDAIVALAENPRVFQSGPCGGSMSYQMPMPTDSDEYNITIDIDPTATFEFRGRFEPAPG